LLGIATNVEHKISAGLKAVSHPALMKFEKGNTVQFGTNTRINFMQCYRQFFLDYGRINFTGHFKRDREKVRLQSNINFVCSIT